ncbi:MAG: glycoside hydrolase family 3 N-terminal domain-containing protein [Nocardioides sp.]|nr:glycoside hydrolase family 3 N-terminal domain-containing protein [Nocardioides sp.]
MPTPVRRPVRAALTALVAVLLLLVTACSTGTDPAGQSAEDGGGTETADEQDAAPSDEPLGWGPTGEELARAQDLVAEWTPEQLAGQVIVGRYHGTDPAVPAALVEDLHLAGVSMTGSNIVDLEQVRATTEGVARAVAATGRDFPPVLGVDQEGGVVAHLDGIATTFPSFATAGSAVERGRAGRRAVIGAARATGLELRSFGFTWVWAPVGDVTVGSADPTIGSRSPSTDPAVAARTVAAATEGYREAGIASTVKHFPGHGAATEDSHEVLPALDVAMPDLVARDLPPFEAAFGAGSPGVMLGHLDVEALAPGVPATLAPEAYDLLRDEYGFEGVAVTDSLGMGAVMALDRPPVAALIAGADLLLMPVDTRRAHSIVTRAVRSGEVPRERVEEAAARVIAAQLWLQRTAQETPVPEDVATRAVAAAQALRDAAVGG